MGLYSYRHPKTGKVKEIFQSMKEPHVYQENGVEWERIFSIPQASVDSRIKDPFSEKEFVSKTGNKLKKETIGDAWDRSQEYSEKRKDKDGLDIKQQKYFENYSKTRKGKRHPKDQSRKVSSPLFDIEL
jgi:hypothetical protein